MDLSKVGEKILSSVKSARSLGLLPSVPDRPEVIQPSHDSYAQLHCHCTHSFRLI